MSGIIGTIINVKNFLSNIETKVKINKGSIDEIDFTLVSGRKYVIPDFQREVKWEKENLIELMKDVSKGKKFLGNLILAQRAHSEYEIIDGQQRITVLLMLIKYIAETYKDEIGKTIVPCILSIESFPLYQMFVQNKYSFDALTPDEREEINKSDIFNQAASYQMLYKAISVKIPSIAPRWIYSSNHDFQNPHRILGV